MIASLALPSRSPESARWLALLLWLCCILPGSAQAVARASVQPDRITLGNTATLIIETDESGAEPDFSVLDAHFVVRGQSRSMQTSIVNGRQSSSTSFQIELEPREAGLVSIPAIPVGSSSTEPLTLTVLPPTPGSPERGDPYYVETELSSNTPYVQQPVLYTVRLYYAVQLVDGNVEARAPEHANLQQIGEDQNRQVEIGGRRYKVFERRYLLTPEQSGTLTLPQAQFRGRAQVDGGRGFFAGVENVSAVSQPQTLQVRPQPDGAPQPWLPARSVALTRSALPTEPRAGEPLMLELQLSADGVTKEQLADLKLPPIAGAQVFPEPAQSTDSIVDGQPVTRRTQRFAIVPAQPGPLTIPAITVDYWNTARDSADQARLEAVTLTIAKGNTAAPIAPAAPVIAPTAPISQSDAGPGTSADPALLTRLRNWQIAALTLAIALVAALSWGWRRGRSALTAAAATPTPARPQSLPAALQSADLKRIAAALCADSDCLSLGALAAQLGDSAQREAVQALDAALWANAESSGQDSLLQQLRSAFKRPIQRIGAAPGNHSNAALPPLYPSR